MRMPVVVVAAVVIAAALVAAGPAPPVAPAGVARPVEVARPVGGAAPVRVVPYGPRGPVVRGVRGARPVGGSRASAPGAGGGSPFVDLRAVDPTVLRDMRYAGERNFTGRRVDGYEEPVCLLARPAALALRRAQRALLRQGYSLLVYDCYRPQRAVDRFVRWAAEPEDPAVRAGFHPRVPKSELFARGYIARRSGHSRGSTVDVTLVRLAGRARPGGSGADGHPPGGSRSGDSPSGGYGSGGSEAGSGAGPCAVEPGLRGEGASVDMGTGFDCFDPAAHTDAPGTGGAQRAHRELLRRALGAQGFVNLPEEWWHFTLKPEAYPQTYFDLPVGVRSAGW